VEVPVLGLMQTLALIENGAKVFIVSRTLEKLEDVAKKYGGQGRGEIVPYVSLFRIALIHYALPLPKERVG